MSGSSFAQHVLTRCIVSLNAGISISWARDPDGSHDSGRRHHEREEAAFFKRLERGAPGIEVIFDELEAAGHVFVAPTEPEFAKCQRATAGAIESCMVRLLCKPALSEKALKELAERVSALVSRLPPPAPVAEPEPPAPEVKSKSWWRRR